MPDQTLHATFTVTVETRPGGTHYDGPDDLARNVIPWIESGLEDRDDIRDVTVAMQEPSAVSEWGAALSADGLEPDAEYAIDIDADGQSFARVLFAFEPSVEGGRRTALVHGITQAVDGAEFGTEAAWGPTLPAADRAAVYAEVADRLAADAEQGGKEGFTRIYRRSAAQQVRAWADELAAEAQQASSSGDLELRVGEFKETAETLNTEARPAQPQPAPKPLLTLATPCAACTHPYNWHQGGICQAGPKENRCGCIAFAAAQQDGAQT